MFVNPFNLQLVITLALDHRSNTSGTHGCATSRHASPQRVRGLPRGLDELVSWTYTGGYPDITKTGRRSHHRLHSFLHCLCGHLRLENYLFCPSSILFNCQTPRQSLSSASSHLAKLGLGRRWPSIAPQSVLDQSSFTEAVHPRHLDGHAGCFLHLRICSAWWLFFKAVRCGW